MMIVPKLIFVHNMKIQCKKTFLKLFVISCYYLLYFLIFFNIEYFFYTFKYLKESERFYIVSLKNLIIYQPTVN